MAAHQDNKPSPATECPRCGGPTNRIFRRALSRKDNRTHVCDSCGTAEAMRDHQGLDVWPNYPQRVPFQAS